MAFPIYCKCGKEKFPDRTGTQKYWGNSLAVQWLGLHLHWQGLGLIPCQGLRTSLVAQMVKASAYNAGDSGLVPCLGRSPGEGNSNPLHYSCLENPMDGGAWWATVHWATLWKKKRSWCRIPFIHCWIWNINILLRIFFFGFSLCAVFLWVDIRAITAL